MILDKSELSPIPWDYSSPRIFLMALRSLLKRLSMEKPTIAPNNAPVMAPNMTPESVPSSSAQMISATKGTARDVSMNLKRMRRRVKRFIKAIASTVVISPRSVRRNIRSMYMLTHTAMAMNNSYVNVSQSGVG